MCCRYYMELSPELRPYVEEARHSALANRMADKYCRPFTGSGDIRADAQIKGAVAVAIAGSGDVKLSGSAESADYSIGGSGDIDARNLAVSGNVSQSVRGSGDILSH